VAFYGDTFVRVCSFRGTPSWRPLNAGITPPLATKAIGDLAAPEKNENLLPHETFEGKRALQGRRTESSVYRNPKSVKVTSHDISLWEPHASRAAGRVRDVLTPNCTGSNLRAMDDL